jgi:hypothetical protein
MESTFQCRRCKGEFPYNPTADIVSIKPTVCAVCEADIVEESRKAKMVERDRKFIEICPPLYAETDPNHPSMPKAKLERVLAWQYGPRGLIGHGVTRKCKSRCFWLLIKRLISEGRSVIAMTGGEFARSCAECYSNGGAASWFHSLLSVDVLFLDDLDKPKFTERVAADLFDLWEQRAANLRPILGTTNAVGDTLIQKMNNPIVAGPLVARIREHCESISFL